jgi:ubiquinol-cytochrome c reductase cytochrome c subunit
MKLWIRWLPVAPAALLVAMLLASPTAWCGPVDDDEREERLEIGRAAFRDNCLMCHAEEMSGRLRLSEKQWTAELDKMIGWGAPVPPEQKGPLLAYLVSQFSDPKASPVAPPARMTPREALAVDRPEGPMPSVGDPSRGATLYTAHCATCHGPEARGGDLGTCLVEKPVLQRSEFAEVVRQGRRRMPGFVAALKPEQEADILAWLRTRRFEAPGH